LARDVPGYQGSDWDNYLLFGPEATWTSHPTPLRSSGAPNQPAYETSTTGRGSGGSAGRASRQGQARGVSESAVASVHGVVTIPHAPGGGASPAPWWRWVAGSIPAGGFTGKETAAPPGWRQQLVIEASFEVTAVG
jgi:hypothetical protein